MNFINPLNWLTIHASPSDGRRRWQERERGKNRRSAIFVAIMILCSIAALMSLGFAWQKPAETPLITNGKIITVRAGGNLQAALNQAQSGDKIVLEAGAQFIGSFELPVKTGTEFVTIESSQIDALPENRRVSPDDAAKMPKILTSGKGQAAVYTVPNAHHYRFAGIEFGAANDDYIYNLIGLGSDKQTTAEMPAFFEFDRCLLRSRGLGKTRRGIALNNRETVIKNSYLAGFAGKNDETQAIAGWNGAGQYQIINNYLEGGAENVMFGGADPSIKNLVPSDIEIRGNLFSKPEAWRTSQPTIKNLLELKNARRVQIVGNIFENCWGCEVFRITVRNQDNSAPWSTIEDVEMRDNLMRKSASGFVILGKDDNYPSVQMKRVKISNNLLIDIDGEKWGAGGTSGQFVQISDTDGVEFSHNTAFFNGSITKAYGNPNKNFVFSHNIVAYNEYGFWTEGGWTKTQTTPNFPGAKITRNIIVNTRSIDPAYVVMPPDNFRVENYGLVGFVNWRGGDFNLSDKSPYKTRSADAKDIGCNIAALNATTKSVETGAMP